MASVGSKPHVSTATVDYGPVTITLEWHPDLGTATAEARVASKTFSDEILDKLLHDRAPSDDIQLVSIEGEVQKITCECGNELDIGVHLEKLQNAASKLSRIDRIRARDQVKELRGLAAVTCAKLLQWLCDVGAVNGASTVRVDAQDNGLGPHGDEGGVQRLCSYYSRALGLRPCHPHGPHEEHVPMVADVSAVITASGGSAERRGSGR